MKKRLLPILLSMLLCLSLAAPALAADGQGVEITWLPANTEPKAYNSKLNWLSLEYYENGDLSRTRYICVDLATGKQVDFGYVGGFSDGLALVGRQGKDGKLKYGYIDETGDVVIALELDGASGFSEGMARVSKLDADGNQKYGYIDTKGRLVVPYEYDAAHDFHEGMALIGKNGTDRSQKYGFVDATGKVIVPPKYDAAYDFSEGLALVKEKNADGNSRYGFIDKTGEVAIPLEYQYANSFSEGLAEVEKDSRCGYIDTSGNYVIQPNNGFITAFDFCEGMAHVRRTDQNLHLWSGFIDKTGKIVVPLEYGYCSGFSEGMAFVEKRQDEDGNRECGFINASGRVVISLEDNSYSEGFSEGLAIVRQGDTNYRYGFIDKTGAELVSITYTDARMLEDGLGNTTCLCCVRNGSTYGIFVNPYYVQKETDGDMPDKIAGDIDLDGGGFPVLPVVLGAVAGAAAVIVVALVLKRKKKPAPTTVTRPTPTAPTAPSDTNFCPNCGKPVKPGTKFCPGCGYSLTDE